MDLIRVGVVRGVAATASLCGRLGWVVAQLLVVEAEIDGIEAHAINAALEPEPQVVQYGLLHFRMVEVQIWLFHQKVVQVVLPASRFPLPSHTTKDGQPVVRRATVGFWVRPDVPIRLGVSTVLAAFAEPFVFDGGVAQHLVNHDAQACSVRLRYKLVEVREFTKHGVDGAVVRDVVAEVAHGRTKERRHPKRVHAEAGQVVHALDDAGQVADAVAVAVLKAARVDLVNDGATPPSRRLGQLGDRKLVVQRLRRDHVVNTPLNLQLADCPAITPSDRIRIHVSLEAARV